MGQVKEEEDETCFFVYEHLPHLLRLIREAPYDTRSNSVQPPNDPPAIVPCNTNIRSVRESAAFAGEGLQLSQAKEIVKVGKGVLDLQSGNELEREALTPGVVKSLQLVIDCYQSKVAEIQKRMRKAEAWMVQAKELMGRESMKMEEMEVMLKTAEDVGVENEDLSKKIRAEMGRCRAWGVKADTALLGTAKLSANAVKKLIIEGEKIKVGRSHDSQNKPVHCSVPGSLLFVEFMWATVSPCDMLRSMLGLFLPFAAMTTLLPKSLTLPFVHPLDAKLKPLKNTCACCRR